MSRRWRILLVLAVALGLLEPVPGLGAQGAATVLIIYSDHDQLPWQNRLTRAVHDALSRAGPGPTVYEEQMDATHFPSAADQRRLGDLIVAKYRGVRIDTVITDSDPAAQFLLDHPDAFPGSRKYLVDTDLTVPPAAGVRLVSHDNVEKTLDLVPVLFPQTKRLVLVDGGEARARLLSEYWRAHRAFQFSFEVWNNLSFAELDHKVSQLPKDTVLVFGILSQDRLGQVEIPFNVARRLFRLAPVPGLVLFDTLVGTGAVGGMVFSASRVGELVADLAEGNRPSADAISFVSPTFDVGALAHWNIPVSRLPEHRVLVNAPKNLLTPEQEITVFAALLAIALLLAAMWVWTVVQNKRRRTLEAQRLEAVDRLVKTSERVPGVVFQFRRRPDGTMSIPFASEAIRKVYGLGPEQVREDASALFGLVHPDDVGRVAAAMEVSARDQTPWEQQYRVQLAGVERFLYGNAVPEKEADGSVLWHGFIADVSERIQADRTIQTQSAQLRSLLDTIPDLIWLKDVDGVYLACNRRYELYRGRPAQDIVGKTDYELVDRGAADQYREFDSEVLRLGIPMEREGDLRFADGHVELTATIKAPFRNADGSLAGVLGIGRDVTQRKRDVEALRQSEDTFLKAFNASPEATFVDSEADRRILVVNDAFRKATGLVQQDILGRSAAELGFKIRPEELPSFTEEFERAGAVRNYDVTFRRASGEVRSFLGNVERIEMYGQKCRLAFLLDVTDIRRIEDERSRLQALLMQSQKLESLGVLASGLAHEMNNVLASILTVSTTKLLTLPFDDPARKAFENIARASERGGKTVSRLLSFTRKAPVQDRELDVNSLVAEQVTLLGETVPSGVQVETSLSPGLPPVLGDRSALIQALANLCSNALDAMGDAGTLTLETHSVPGQVEVSVRDTGGGMPQDVLERALDPFFTTKAPGKGTGLGLSLVYTTVQAHRGRMEIQSEPGKGTVVKLLFPAQTNPGTSGGRPPPALPVVRSSKRILLVDDDAMIRESMRDLLEAMGHQVAVVSGGREALGCLERAPLPDVVLLDMNMPEMDGEETLAKLRERYQDLPVVLTTGRSDQSALDLVSSFPKVFLLPKPFEEAALALVLAEATPSH